MENFYFAKGTAYFNPHNHLKRCAVKDAKADLFNVYERAIERRQKFGSFPCEDNIITMKLSQRERAIQAYMNMIIMKLLQLSIVEGNSIRNFC